MRPAASPPTTVTSKFRSKFEGRIAAALTKQGVDFKYEVLTLPYTLELEYKPDFILPNGVIVETKGAFPTEDRRKMVAVKRQYPELDIRICFMRASEKLSKAPRSLTYWQWAEKAGFLWCEGAIPPSWYADAVQVRQA